MDDVGINLNQIAMTSRPYDPVPIRALRYRIGADVHMDDTEIYRRLTPSTWYHYDPASVRAWGHRVGSAARGALGLARNPSMIAERWKPRSRAVTRYLGDQMGNHPLGIEVLAWLSLTERQATETIAHFLNEGGPSRILAFLNALAPDFQWPNALDAARVLADNNPHAERIDLLVTGLADGRTWGAVVEAKFGHTLNNPLGTYARIGQVAYGLSFEDRDGDRATAVLAVLALSKSKATRRRLAYNRKWRFVYWSGFVRRFERAVSTEEDAAFRHFRATLWRRII